MVENGSQTLGKELCPFVAGHNHSPERAGLVRRKGFEHLDRHREGCSAFFGRMDISAIAIHCQFRVASLRVGYLPSLSKGHSASSNRDEHSRPTVVNFTRCSMFERSVSTAPDRKIHVPREQFKARCTRRLIELVEVEAGQ